MRDTYLEMETEMKALDAKRAEWDALMKKANEHAAAAPRKIKLDIGGEKFTTTKDTLNKFKNSFFYAMIGSGKWSPDEDGCYFVDRDPTYFHHVMEYMRSGDTDFLTLGNKVLERVRQDFDFYQIAFPALQLMAYRGY
jgi:BTB/POZ domain-containing adapter for CUL3-mediated RhoA degradation protein